MEEELKKDVENGSNNVENSNTQPEIASESNQVVDKTKELLEAASLFKTKYEESEAKRLKVESDNENYRNMANKFKKIANGESDEDPAEDIDAMIKRKADELANEKIALIKPIEAQKDEALEKANLIISELKNSLINKVQVNSNASGSSKEKTVNDLPFTPDEIASLKAIYPKWGDKEFKELAQQRISGRI